MTFKILEFRMFLDTFFFFLTLRITLVLWMYKQSLQISFSYGNRQTVSPIYILKVLKVANENTNDATSSNTYIKERYF